MRPAASASVAPRSRPVPPVLAAGALVLAVFLAYFNTITAPFIFDDGPAILPNESIKSLWPLGPVLQPPADGGTSVAGRPIVNLSLAVNHAVSGLNPWSYHVTNILIHAGATLLLFGLTRRALTGPVLRAAWGDRAGPLALGLALLWALHPLQTESVAFVIQRTESLVGFFYLLTLYGLARMADATTRAGRLGWSAAGLGACLLGMATKEVMVTAPVIALLYDRTFIAGSFRGLAPRRWLHAGFFATWGLLFYLLQGNPLRGGTAGFDNVTSWQYLLTQCRGITLYLKLTLWPHPLVMDYGKGFVRELPAVLPQALLLVALAGGTVWALWRRPLVGFLGAWFFIILSPSSSVVPLATQTIAEHRVYLPLAAVLALAVGLLARRRPGLVLPVCMGLAVVLGVVTMSRNRLYRDPAAIWQDNLVHWPENFRPYSALAGQAEKAGDFAAAVGYYEILLRAQPEDHDTRFNYARDLVKLERRTEAIAQFELILRDEPGNNPVRINLAASLLALRRTDEALAQFETAVRFNPRSADNQFNLAEARVQAGRLPEAVDAYQQAVELKPESGLMHYRHGDALLKLGRPAEAVAAYRAAVAHQPDLHAAWTNLGGASMMLGRVAEAVAAFEAALRLKPGDPATRNNLDYARSQLAANPTGRDR